MYPLELFRSRKVLSSEKRITCNYSLKASCQQTDFNEMKTKKLKIQNKNSLLVQLTLNTVAVVSLNDVGNTPEFQLCTSLSRQTRSV